MNKSDAAFDAFVGEDSVSTKKPDKEKAATSELRHLKSIQEYWNAQHSDSNAA